MSEQDLIQEAFYYINTFKRHRVLEQIRKNEGKHDELNYHQLKQYQMLEAIEFTLRAIQKGKRESDSTEK